MKPTIALCLVVGLALGLRLWGARTGRMMFDESTHLAAAQVIDFRPDRFRLVHSSVDHPPMSVHVVRASTYLFGGGLFGMRALHAIAGAITVLAVFFLARATVGPRAALGAAGLLAVDQFHVTWSYFAVPEVLMLLLAALALGQYARALDGGGRGAFIGFGIFLGLAYLAKESAVFLIPALWLGAAVDARFRGVFRNRWWYLAHLIAAAVVLPEVLWNITHFYESYYHRDTSLVGRTLGISPRAFLLYIGELAPRIGGPFQGFTDDFATQNPAPVHWPAGLLYLGAATLALFRVRDAWCRLYFVLFAVLFAEFTLLPGEGNLNYWWPSLTLPPVVVLAGMALRDGLSLRSAGGRRLVAALAMIAFAYLLGRAAVAVNRPGNGVQFSSAEERVRNALEIAEAARTPEELIRADVHLYYAVLVAGGRPSLYAQLARSSCARGEPQRARYFADRTLKLEPDNAIARGIAEEMAAATTPRCGFDSASAAAGSGSAGNGFRQASRRTGP
jgi:4-amino-4-deoxy-L-arabinose transferase-like glycosyltransferase